MITQKQNSELSFEQRIDNMIITQLDKINPTSAKDVNIYRDVNFPSGRYDALFENYIKQKKLPKW